MDLFQKQYELEREMITSGVDRYRDQQEELRNKGRESETAPGRKIISAAIPKTAAAIEEFIEVATSGKAGRRHTAVKFLKGQDTGVLAYLTSKSVLDAVTTRNASLQSVALTISSLIQDEMGFREFEKQAPRLWQVVSEDLNNRTTNYKHGRTVLNLAAKRAALAMPDRWSNDDSLRVGTKLVELFTESTGLVSLVLDVESENRNRRGKNGTYVIRPCQETLDWIRGMDSTAELLCPLHMPCVVEPKDWTTPTDGGYLGPMAHKLTLVKTRNRPYLEELSYRDMPVVYTSVNALQRTQWAINKPILGIMREAMALQLPIGNLPTGNMLDLPQKPADIEVNEEARKEWREKARNVYQHNRRVGTQAVQLARTVSVAEKYQEFEAIYFPYTLDFRGRAYPVTGMLNPQGSDVAKGLLRFSGGKPIGENGAAWLAIHLANNYGFDKASLEERIRWVEDNEEHIMASAMSPLDYTWWSEGDSPWQVLAACFEWMGYRLEGESFVSHLPVAMDGSCNGLQHYSAMLRDPVGGSAVNLVAHETPADIYTEVLNRSLVGLNEIAASDRGEEDEAVALAQAILASGQVDRTMCKRPVMTMPYGSKQYGIRGQIVEELNARKAKAGDVGFEDIGMASSLLAKLVWDSIGNTVVAAKIGMDWLQKVASLASAEGLPISWVAPNGLPVLQEYRSLKERRVKTQFAGTSIRMVMKEADPDKLDKPKQRNGIAPNFVHSLDASAMMLTVVAAEECGLTAFSMVHDSYATHAADADVLALCLRREFVSMYELNDVLEGFGEEIRAQLSPENREKLPEPPARGDLDLAQVLESDFFFA